MFIIVLFTRAKTWEQPKCPSTDKWVKKTWYVCIYIHIYICVCVCVCVYTYIYIFNRILFSHKNEILPFATTQMNLEYIMPSK